MADYSSSPGSAARLRRRASFVQHRLTVAAVIAKYLTLLDFVRIGQPAHGAARRARALPSMSEEE